ncbi:hypothetical protein MAR_017344 [Mya arenaria]|uniref:Secreted protein n=1 Tax=Mya arenaria TaxID=6604 RepID=A0ABY7EEY9_MYAAR|nr:hypothetical protein MAR_017344 [Mya arenaria]
MPQFGRHSKPSKPQARTKMYRVYHSPSLLVLLSLVMSLLRAVCADWERVCTPFTRSFGAHPGGICGHRLDEMLDVLCVDGYNQYPSQSSGYGGRGHTDPFQPLPSVGSAHVFVIQYTF